MVKSATRSYTLNLRTLEKILQKRLYSESLRLVPLQIRCFVRDKTLTIIIQHPDPVLSYPRKVFTLLTQILEEQEVTLRYNILIYLRVHDQKRPYGFHSLKVKPNPPFNSSTNIEFLEQDQEETFINKGLEFEEKHKVFNDYSNIDSNNNFSQSSSVPNFIQEDNLEDEEEFGYNNESLDYSISDDEEDKKSWRKWIIFALSSSVILFFTTLYLLTRPCVIGQCEAINKAQEYANNSTQILQQNPSGKAIFHAQNQLEEAIILLETIPQWSIHHNDAESLLNNYQIKAQTLDDLINALKIASQASLKAQNPPYEVERWQEIQQDWREAIARLESINNESDLYPLSQAKIVEYQKNLNIINQRLNQEVQALKTLNLAKETIKIAQVRQGTAQSLENWQLVFATWQTAIEKLKEIPESTTTFEKAQILMSDYAPAIAQARERKNQELFAANAYNQGLRLAQLAKNSESINQWTSAVYHWRNALNYIKQVPKTSFQYNQALPLLDTYQNAFN